MRRYASAYRTPRQRFSQARREISKLASLPANPFSSGMSITLPPHNPTPYRPADCREADGQSTCQSARCGQAGSSSTSFIKASFPMSKSAPPLHRPILQLQVSEPRRKGELTERKTASARQRSRRSCADPAVLSTDPAAQALRSGERSSSTASSLRGVLKAYNLTRLSS